MEEANKDKRLIKKMRLLAVLIHSLPQGDLEGLRRLAGRKRFDPQAFRKEDLNAVLQGILFIFQLP